MTAPRADQPGYEALQSELDQNRVMALWMPLLVLAISSMSLFIALSRLVTAQRGEIGLAKALGYTDARLVFHYLSFALIIAAGGSLLGVGLGLLGARGVAATYTGFLGLPFLESGIYPGVLAVAVGVAVVVLHRRGDLPGAETPLGLRRPWRCTPTPTSRWRAAASRWSSGCSAR